MAVENGEGFAVLEVSRGATLERCFDFDFVLGRIGGPDIFDQRGNYAQIIMGAESRVFGSKVFCAFGTYKIDESEKVLITRIDGCSASKLNGTVQNRAILSLTKEELRYTNPVTASGTVAEARWKRLG